MKFFLGLSLISLIFSIIASIITIYSIVFRFGKTWDLNQFLLDAFVNQYSDEKAEEKKKATIQIKPSWYWKILPMGPHQFNNAILIHLSLLLLGLILYAIAIIF